MVVVDVCGLKCLSGCCVWSVVNAGGLECLSGCLWVVVVVAVGGPGAGKALSAVHLHVCVQLVFLGERTAAQVAQVRTDASVHGAQMPAQHLTQQEPTATLATLKPTLTAVCQHVARQLAAT